MGLVIYPESTPPILVDASFLISVYDRHEPHHRRCMAVLDQVNQPLVTCEPVITEAIHLLATIREGQLNIPFQLVKGTTEVLAAYLKYADTPCDFADACLIAMANELNTGDILTLDSDFKHYRWHRNKRFRLLIPLD